MSSLAPIAPAVKTPLPKTAAERVRELASIHRAFCRHCRQGLRCSIDSDLRENANRLEQNEAAMAVRREALEASNV